MEQITDGTGKGYLAKVDENNRLSTFSVSETVTELAARSGNSYNVNTGTITLTSASESGLLYLKNNGDNDLIIISIGYLLGDSTGGSGDIQAKVIFNPTGGTVISGATDVDININKNAGSSKVLDVDAYKGEEGRTITGGSDAYYSLIAGDSRGYVISTGSLVFPKGSSLGIALTPQTGNTNMDLQVFLSIVEDANI